VEPVVLTGFMMNGGNQTNIDKATWYTKLLEEKLGIRLEFMDAAGVDSAQIIQSLLASDDLPDVIGFSGGSTYAGTAAQSGKLLNLDEHQDALPEVYQNDLYKYSLMYSRDSLSGGTGKAFALPTAVGTEDTYANYDIQMRWDIYKQVGSPKIAQFEDYLAVGKLMQDAYPETPDGQKVYAFSIFPEWDGDGMLFAWETPLVWSRRNLNGYIEVDVSGKDGGSTTKGTFDDDASYLRLLKFFYQANQMGILDPDSATQKWENLDGKYKDGRVLWAMWQWAVASFNTEERINSDPPAGYASVWSDDMVQPVSADAWTGRLESMAVSSKAKDLDAALRWLNYYFSYEHMSFANDGPEGELWEVGSDGKRVRTEKGWAAKFSNIQDTLMDGGGLIADAKGIYGTFPMTPETLYPAIGQSVASDQWDDVLYRDPSKLLADWRAAHGNVVDMLREAKATPGKTSKITPAVDMMSAVPDDIQTLIGQIKDAVVTNSWKMVYAKDQAEFDALWADLKTKAAGLGLAETQEWARKEWVNKIQEAEKYKP
jgi:putative aldouronate transport system substrate-binding protein